MVNSFLFSRLPQIIFGAGKISLLPALLKQYGTEILIITGKKSFTGSPEGMKLFSMLSDSGINLHHAVVEGEPSVEMVDLIVSNFRSRNLSVVVAIGGGSVLDAGKAVSVMITVNGSVEDYLEGVGGIVHPGSKIPFVAVPTTSGTGSEATKNAVISRIGQNGFKRSLRHENFVPDIALVDPELTLNCPSELTASSGLDCFTQLTEAYLSVKSNVFTDSLALAGISELKKSLVDAFHNGNDIVARTGMSFAALTSGICLANAGLGVVHGFASSIGGMYRIPHGIICGTLMGAANKITVRELRKTENNCEALGKYSTLGKIFLPDKPKSDEYYIDGFLDQVDNITELLKLPGLRQCGIEEKDLKIICGKTENKNNPAKLGYEELEEILQKRYF